MHIALALGCLKVPLNSIAIARHKGNQASNEMELGEEDRINQNAQDFNRTGVAGAVLKTASSHIEDKISTNVANLNDKDDIIGDSK